MPVHLAQRMHAFVHGLFRSSDMAETRDLCERVELLYTRVGLDPLMAQTDVAMVAVSRAAAVLNLDVAHPQRRMMQQLARALLLAEGHFVLPDIDWSEHRSITVWWELRDTLNAERSPFGEF